MRFLLKLAKIVSHNEVHISIVRYKIKQQLFKKHLVFYVVFVFLRKKEYY